MPRRMVDPPIPGPVFAREVGLLTADQMRPMSEDAKDAPRIVFDPYHLFRIGRWEPSRSMWVADCPTAYETGEVEIELRPTAWAPLPKIPDWAHEPNPWMADYESAANGG